MEYSTEELFLKVLAQIAKRRKHNRTLEDDCKELLRSETQRKLVEDLKRDQNAWLQKRHPQLVWKLAGLECTYRKRRNSAEETRRIKVILKTEWDPGPHPMGPAVRDGLGYSLVVGPVMDSPVALVYLDMVGLQVLLLERALKYTKLSEVTKGMEPEVWLLAGAVWAKGLTLRYLKIDNLIPMVLEPETDVQDV